MSYCHLYCNVVHQTIKKCNLIVLYNVCLSMLVLYHTKQQEVAHMKNTYFKKVAVACVATIAFIGIHNPTVEAITEYQVVNVDSLAEIGQAYAYGPIMYELKQENNEFDDEKEFIPYKPDLFEKQSQETKVDEPAITESKTPEPEVVAPPEPATPAVSISNEEKDLFARLVEAEAKGESYEGKVAVATVVLNRVDSTEFPDTISGVINEVVGNAYAFSPVQNGKINEPASDESIRAVEEALTRQDRLNDCIYFYNPDIATDTWITTREVVKTVGNHVFAK
jgi:N-acetylmuramoyl-L-alanine amidase